MARQQLKIAKMAEWVEKGTTPQRVFNKFDLKTMQRAILNCLQVSDVIANLPTGFGKSLLFQYPASLQKVNKKCIIVIVPLKALLWDTIREARDLGIIAQQIDYKVISDYYRNDALPQMLLATPEKVFASEGTMNFIQSLHAQEKIRLLVIDECHCISQWGHDFRPAYLQLQKLREVLSGVRLLAISATITVQTRVDLTKRLFLYSAHYFQASYHRFNLYYGVIKCKQKKQIQDAISLFLKQNKLQQQSGIIYCQTISGAEALAKSLNDFKVGLFHSKLSEKMRKETYDNFMEEKIKIMIGTICFGMGINKKNIRFVINVGVSKSPQNYYQESGRAGRDGLPAHCVIVSFPNQTNSISFLISKGSRTAKQKSHQFVKLQQIEEYAEEENECRRKKLFLKLGQKFNPQNCEKMCDNCRRDKEDKSFKTMDFYKQAKQILEDLQTAKHYFTKNQLSTYLKGKPVYTTKRGKKSELFLGDEIKGIFKNQKMELIEKIIDGMVSKGLLIREGKIRTKYLVNYFKAANKNSTKSFKQFIITIEQKPEKIQNVKKANKFDRFLEKKGVQDLKPRTKTTTLDEMAPEKTMNQNEVLIEAEVVKEKVDYQPFFNELFGDQLYSDLQKKQASGEDLQFDGDMEQLNPIEEIQQYEDQNCLAEDLPEDVSEPRNVSETATLTNLITRPTVQRLKRPAIDPKKLDNMQF